MRLWLAVAVIFLLGVSAWGRNTFWRTDARLYEDTASKSPNKPRVRGNYGLALEHEGYYLAAERELKRTIEIAPWFAAPYVALGNIALRFSVARGQGRRLTEAFLYHREALLRDSTVHDAWVGLGTAWALRGQNEMAAAAFHEATKHGTDRAPGYNNLGAMLLKMGHRCEAEEAYEMALRYNPHFDMAHKALGKLYRMGSCSGPLVLVKKGE